MFKAILQLFHSLLYHQVSDSLIVQIVQIIKTTNLWQDKAILNSVLRRSWSVVPSPELQTKHQLYLDSGWLDNVRETHDPKLDIVVQSCMVLKDTYLEHVHEYT